MKLEPNNKTQTLDDSQWRFHLLGSKAVPESKAFFQGSFQSSAYESLFLDEYELSHFPLVVAEDHTIVPLKTFILNRCQESGGNLEILSAHTDFFVFCTSEALKEAALSMELLPALKAGLAVFLKKMELSEAGRNALNEELDTFFEDLPVARCLGFGPQAGLQLYCHGIIASRGERVSSFVQKAVQTRQALENILAVQDAKEKEKSQKNLESLGTVGGAMFKAGSVSPRKSFGTIDLSAARRSRIESCIQSIEQFIAGSASGPKIILLHKDGLSSNLFPENVVLQQKDQPMAAAMDVFNAQISEMTELFKSLRTAHLEVNHAYDESYHQALFDQFSMAAFTQEEWSMFPVVAVLEDASAILKEGMNDFSAILSTNLPINLLLQESPWSEFADPSEPFQSAHRDLGYLAMAHRDSFVLRSSVSQPVHLFEGYSRMALEESSCVAIVTTPGNTGISWDSLHAYHSGRGSNLYTYDPANGTQWADRFNVDGSPDTVAIWPEFTTSKSDSDSQDIEIMPFTFADAVSTLPAQRNNFMVLTEDLWNESQVPLADFLLDAEKLYGHFVPYIQVLNADKQICRAILSRSLALKCLDHQDLWLTLRELAGIENSHAIRLGQTIKSETETLMREEIEALKTQYQEEIEVVRIETARDALGQLARVLVEMDPGQELQLGQAAAPAAPAPAAVQEESTQPEPAEPTVAETPAEPEEEEEEMAEEAFVETDLCTSCNECVALNPLLFIYDSNKQVEIGDVNAGNFLQLVSAAEKCPSRCIHPGTPRSDDSTVTEELIAKAAKYN